MTEDVKDRLIEAAILAAENAYCPYSNFAVGAAVLGGSGRIFSGCNVENAAYGSTMCAERTAVFKAVLEGECAVEAVAIYHADGFAYPCGACLQVIAEFNKNAEIVLVTEDDVIDTDLNKLLPNVFSIKD